MIQKKEIENIEDIKLLVNEFYGKVRQEELLKDIFESIIKDRWPEHLDKMYSFWQTVLLGEHTYKGSPFPPHAVMPVEIEHFETWLKLWAGTVNNYFVGEKADRAIWQGQRMAEMFLSKIRYMRDTDSVPLN